jgi:protein gp37
MSKIEWTEQTWNPIIGCTKISEGCKECYAAKMAGRLANIPYTSYYMNVVKEKKTDLLSHKPIGEWNGKTSFIPSALEKPLKRKKPTMYFVCSMGDLFHESVLFEWIDKVFRIIQRCDKHIFQILTKRPEIALKYFKHLRDDFKLILPFNNIWLGVTAENQKMANKRIPILLQIPAKVHFVSVEPMLSEIDLDCLDMPHDIFGVYNALHGSAFNSEIGGYKLMSKLDWVICGGESGPNARPMHPDWVRSLRDQCKNANVPFFFKQGSQNNWNDYKNIDSFPEDLKIRQYPKI